MTQRKTAPATPPANNEIWDKVKATDPAFTKKFDNGTFKGTAISPTYNYSRATEIFGPCGFGWGHEIVDSKYVHGNEMVDKQGVNHGQATTHVVQINFWYKHEGEKCVIPAIGETPHKTLTGTGKLKTDHDAEKKSLTDAIGKALQMLGFAADIYMGQFDDISYVENLKDEIELEKAEGDSDEIRRIESEYLAEKDRVLNLIKTSINKRELDVLFTTFSKKALMTGRDDKKSVVEAMKLKDERIKYLDAKKAEDDAIAEKFKEERLAKKAEAKASQEKAGSAKAKANQNGAKK